MTFTAGKHRRHTAAEHLTLLFALCCFLPPIVDGQTWTEGMIRTEIMRNYIKGVRPTVAATEVTVGIAVTSLVKVSPIEGTIELGVWLRCWWKDARLAYSHFNHSVSTMSFTHKEVWNPDVILYVSAAKPLGGLLNTDIAVYPDGSMMWSRPGVLVSPMPIVLRDFPFDKQRVMFEFGSWTYDTGSINLTEVKPVDMLNFLASPEWKIWKSEGVLRIEKYACCVNPYASALFTLDIQRLPDYFIFNFMGPTICMALATSLGFLAPWDGGERLGLMMTTTLTITVILTTVQGYLPPTDGDQPYFATLMQSLWYVCFGLCVLAFVSLRIRSIRYDQIPLLGPLLGFSADDDNSEASVLHPTLVKQFNRYDLDRSGHLNSPEEFQQVCLSLVFKLGLTTPKAVVVHLTSPKGPFGKLTDENTISLSQFCIWFTNEFHAAHILNKTCLCGNEYHKESQFCRKCGKERPTLWDPNTGAEDPNTGADVGTVVHPVLTHFFDKHAPVVTHFIQNPLKQRSEGKDDETAVTKGPICSNDGLYNLCADLMVHLGLPVDLSPARQATEPQGEIGDLHDDNTICLKQFARWFPEAFDAFDAIEAKCVCGNTYLSDSDFCKLCGEVRIDLFRSAKMKKLQNTKAVNSSDLKYSKLELLELQQSHFCRYDLDRSGTMNSSEELSQLTMSLVFKLQLVLPVQVLKNLLGDIDSLEDEPWSFSRFKEWFDVSIMSYSNDNIVPEVSPFEVLLREATAGVLVLTPEMSSNISQQLLTQEWQLPLVSDSQWSELGIAVGAVAAIRREVASMSVGSPGVDEVVDLSKTRDDQKYELDRRKKEFQAELLKQMRLKVGAIFDVTVAVSGVLVIVAMVISTYTVMPEKVHIMSSGCYPAAAALGECELPL